MIQSVKNDFLKHTIVLFSQKYSQGKLALMKENRLWSQAAQLCH